MSEELLHWPLKQLLTNTKRNMLIYSILSKIGLQAIEGDVLPSPSCKISYISGERVGWVFSHD